MERGPNSAHAVTDSAIVCTHQVYRDGDDDDARQSSPFSSPPCFYIDSPVAEMKPHARNEASLRRSLTMRVTFLNALSLSGPKMDNHWISSALPQSVSPLFERGLPSLSSRLTCSQATSLFSLPLSIYLCVFQVFSRRRPSVCSRASSASSAVATAATMHSLPFSWCFLRGASEERSLLSLVSFLAAKEEEEEDGCPRSLARSLARVRRGCRGKRSSASKGRTGGRARDGRRARSKRQRAAVAQAATAAAGKRKLRWLLPCCHAAAAAAAAAAAVVVVVAPLSAADLRGKLESGCCAAAAAARATGRFSCENLAPILQERLGHGWGRVLSHFLPSSRPRANEPTSHRHRHSVCTCSLHLSNSGPTLMSDTTWYAEYTMRPKFLT